jgi:PAS domain S-box-containing protein
MSHLREGRSWSGEFLVRRKDGTSFPAVVTDSPIHDDKGALVGIVGVSSDITERKKAEDALQQANDELEQRVAQRTSEFMTANAILKEEIRERKRAEDALRVSEERFRLMVECVTDYAIFSLDTAGRIVSWNEGATRLKGYRADEIVGQHFSACYTPEDCLQGKPEQALRIAATEDRYEDECWVVRKDGSRFWANIIITALRDEEGVLQGFVEITRDSTERKLAEEALRESEERYRAFINQSSEAIWRLEFEAPIPVTLPVDEQVELFYRYGYLAECNMAMARMYGYSSPEEIVGARLGDYLIRSDPQNTEFLRAAIRTGYQLAEVESHEVDRDGRSKWFLNNFVGIIEGGFIIRMWGTQRDVTERKHAEEARRRAEEKYHSIFENAVEGIFQSTPDGRFLSVNPAMARMCGYDSPEEMIAHHADIDRQHYVDPMRRAEFRRLMEDQGGVVQGFEAEVYRKDGSKFWTSKGARAVRDQKGAMLYYEGFVEDITERVRAQEELRVSEESYRRLVELSPDTIIVVSEGKIEYVNPAGVKFYGATGPEQIVGLPALDFVHPDFVELVKERMRKTQVGEKTELVEQKHVRLDGQVVDVEVTGTGIIYRGKRGALVIIRDITERVRAREARVQLQLRLLTAQEEERHRISRELHDQMGQHLPALMLGLKALKDSVQNGLPAVDRLQQLQDLAERIARDSHALARDLRPAALDDFGLHTALSNYLDEWSGRYGISVDFHSTGFDEDERLPLHIEITLYRTAQEALTNVIKHAQAEHVSLILERCSEAVLAVVEDDGRGFNVEAVLGAPISERRLGLLGMQERVELVGGMLTIESARGAGTTVVARIPVSTRSGESYAQTENFAG